MRFHFDLQFDGRVWPLLPPGRRASFGEAWIGPERLIEWIELWTGHVTPPRSTAERIAETSVRLARLDGFFRASFEVEPLETTRRLIAVRDELVAAGFDGATGSAEPEEPTILGQWRAIDAQVSPG
ncbi:MAG: hypothetical protein KC609_06975 [Myxococcales bacterium]|nr:hypothetical protein [Myxococcales bacterium]